MKRTRQAGFTLLETTIALVSFTAIAGALALATRASQQTERTVNEESKASRSVRAISRGLTDELRSSSDSQITVTALPDGNSTLRFRIPVQNGTTLGWGVYDRTLGTTEAAQNRAGWSLQYTVASSTANGVTTRRLVRQVLDAANHVQKQTTVLDRLHSGSEVPPGFTVTKQGAMWEVRLAAEPRTPQGQAIQELFHVQARNQ